MKYPCILLFIVFIFIRSVGVAQNDSVLTNQNDSVWAAVHDRWTAWSEVDAEGFIGQHHPEWKRWGFSSSGLLEVKDLRNFFDEWQKDERYVSFELSLIDMEVFDNGFCAVHYLVEARVEWIGEPFTASTGAIVKKGDQTTIRTRWSDFLVREQGRWLYVGGYRDGNCAIWPGYGKPCKE
ncbi:hypothetical protein [Marinoscillum furvescens]|uniref:SnoaL-like protein n=1 Tax=Marinoscillum furvescens DSM 4134 TaxID=1122208 RepID=A0A3D9KX76_MARFU|nr:hypothetical protein [Marinoscillum furvescens]RED92993.1 hypothetical protein C7460_12717 [Marinoscillum furvescens DSM 4134]